MHQDPAVLHYTNLETYQGGESPYKIATIYLNRPAQANAFDGEMLTSIKEKLDTIKGDKRVRLVLFQGTGTHFSGGADLHWMLNAAERSYEHNLVEASKLTDMLETLSELDVPTIAMVKGAAIGGAVGIVACCDFAIAAESATFSLNEAQLGLIPAVVLPYVNRKTSCGQLRRHVLGGKAFGAQDAKDFGLVQVVTKCRDLESVVRSEINQLLQASPEAQGSYKRLQKYLSNNSYQQGPYTAAAIAIARASDFGQSGLRCFLQNEPAPWVCRLPDQAQVIIG